MKIKDFRDYTIEVKYFPEFQDNYYFGGGEFLDADEKSIIYANLCNKDFLNKVNDELENKISIDMDINEINLTNITIRNQLFGTYDSLKEIGIIDGNHEGYLTLYFNINNETRFHCDLDINVDDVQNAVILEECSIVRICKGRLFPKLTID